MENQEFEGASELERYVHHMSLFPMGEDNQTQVMDSAVLIIGVGGLGSVSSTLLTRAGVGRIGIVDRDVVGSSDLQRQILYTTQDVGQRKVLTASRRLNEINPDIRIEVFDTAFDEKNAHEIVGGYSMVIDGTDNMETRYLINRACLAHGIPYVYGAVERFDGQVSVFWKDRGPCFACLFPELNTPSVNAEKPAIHVFSPLVLMVGALQANEAMKIMTGMNDPLLGKLLIFNTLEMRFDKVIIPRRKTCPVCGT